MTVTQAAPSGTLRASVEDYLVLDAGSWLRTLDEDQRSVTRVTPPGRPMFRQVVDRLEAKPRPADGFVRVADEARATVAVPSTRRAGRPGRERLELGKFFQEPKVSRDGARLAQRPADTKCKWAFHVIGGVHPLRHHARTILRSRRYVRYDAQADEHRSGPLAVDMLGRDDVEVVLVGYLDDPVQEEFQEVVRNLLSRTHETLHRALRVDSQQLWKCQES